MTEPRIQTYQEFWPYYLGEHRKKTTRVLHAMGTVLGLSVVAAGALSGQWRWVPLALVPGYGFAWFSHFFIERNRPATFRYPWWSFISDFRMLGEMLRGRL